MCLIDPLSLHGLFLLQGTEVHLIVSVVTVSEIMSIVHVFAAGHHWM